MNTYQPYTYLIGWSNLDKWYYGVRFAKNCHPNDLWIRYFTSSKYVALLREEHGEPDVVQVRKTFETSDAARKWELTVLQRMNVVSNARWVNRAVNNSIDPDCYREIARERMLSNNPMKNSETARRVGKKTSERNRKTFSKMTVEERKKFGSPGETNPFYGKRHPKELQEQINQKISGNYIIIDPQGNVKQINNLHRYCKEHNLNRDILMKHMGKEPVPEPIYRTNSVARHNTTGYTISRL